MSDESETAGDSRLGSSHGYRDALTMHFNEGVVVPVVPLSPQGTNSTMFTACCSVAICEDQPNCPHCKRPIIGHAASTPHERSVVRWKHATGHWKR